MSNPPLLVLNAGTHAYAPVAGAKFPDNSLVKVRRLKHLRHLPEIGAVLACVPAGVSPSYVLADRLGLPRPLMIQQEYRSTYYLIAFEDDSTPHLLRERDLIATEGEANISFAA